MKYFITKTKSKLFLEEITTFGLSSKDDSKIGSKGTGLKFSIAYLHRMGLHVQISNGKTWISTTQEKEIKGKIQSLIYLVANDGETIPMGLTTHVGEDSWTQPWFIIREFVQNAVDEGGEYFVSESIPETVDGQTLTAFELNSELENAVNEFKNYFNPSVKSEDKLTVNGLFYKGFLVHKLENAYCSYDVSQLPRDILSEDRTLSGDLGYTLWKHVRSVDNSKSYLKQMIFNDTNSDIVALMNYLAMVGNEYCLLKCQEKDYYLRSLDILFRDINDLKPNDKVVIGIENNEDNVYKASALGYKYIVVSKFFYQLNHRMGDLIPTLNTIKPATEKYTLASPDNEMRTMVKSFSKKLGLPSDWRFIYVKDTNESWYGLTDPKDKVIYLAVDKLEGYNPSETIVEEIAHAISGYGDGDIGFEKWLIGQLSKRL